MRRELLALSLAAALPLALACKPKEGAETQGESAADVVPSATPGEIPGVDNNNPNDITPPTAQAMIDDVTIGHKVGADGTIAEADQGDDFAPGDPVYITMKVGDVPAGSQVKVVWIGPGEAKIGEDTKAVAAGVSTLSFEATNTAKWAKGDYRAEVWVGDEKVNDQHFNETVKSGAGR
jgi:hypothetical protein